MYQILVHDIFFQFILAFLSVYKMPMVYSFLYEICRIHGIMLILLDRDEATF